MMYPILHGTNGRRRHEVDFGDDPVVVNVAMSDSTVQITMTAPDDPNPDQPPGPCDRTKTKLAAQLAVYSS
jgi:hypothetical protein